MVEIEILEFKKNIYAGETHIGEVLVEIKGKLKVWYKIMKSKGGKPFCVSPGIKIDEKWEPVFQLSEAHRNQTFCHDILLKVIEEGHVEQ